MMEQVDQRSRPEHVDADTAGHTRVAAAGDDAATISYPHA